MLLRLCKVRTNQVTCACLFSFDTVRSSAKEQEIYELPDYIALKSELW
jgi:hypothetical protein